jgi:hypothetical protein
MPFMQKHILYSFGIFLLLANSSFAQTDANVNINGITIYIDYPDVPASVTPDQLDSLINGITYGEPGVERTFRNYWHEQSRRNIDLTHDVFFLYRPRTRCLL